MIQPYFTYKNIKLYNTDSTVLQFNTPFVDLTVTSPPYNINMDYDGSSDKLRYYDYIDKFSHTWLFNTWLMTKTGGRLCLNLPIDTSYEGKNPVYADLVKVAQQTGWKYRSTILWNKGNIENRTAWGSYKQATAPNIITPVEAIVVFYKGDEWKREGGKSDITKKEFASLTNGLWTFGGETNIKNHPAPFPKLLPYNCIKLFSFVGDTIFDPFAGTGTTLIVAANNNRNAIGFELSENYCGVAKQRIIDEVGLLC